MDYKTGEIKRKIASVFSQLSVDQKKQIADKEGIKLATLYLYVGGKIKTYALAEKLIQRGTEIINEQKVKP